MPGKKTSTSSSSPSPSSIPSVSSIRRSTRVRVPPQTYRPTGRNTIPDTYSSMIHSIAKSQAQASNIDIENSAIIALENALEEVLDTMFTIATDHASSKGRKVIEEEDLKEATKQMKFNKQQ